MRHAVKNCGLAMELRIRPSLGCGIAVVLRCPAERSPAPDLEFHRHLLLRMLEGMQCYTADVAILMWLQARVA